MPQIVLPQAEPRFLWNNYMLEVLIDNKVRLMSKLLSVLHASFYLSIYLCSLLTAEHLYGSLCAA
jgi:hypothetical protein